MLRETILFFHFLGFGTFVAIQLASFILESQYKKAPDLQTKAIILRALRPIGLLSPIAIIIQLISGIGNMQMLGYGLLDMGWLTAKIIFFAIAVISGVTMGIKSRKRGTLVGQMVQGKAPADAEKLLKEYDKELGRFFLVMPLLLILILCLSIYGRLGGQ